jgi:hypothetical protein
LDLVLHLYVTSADQTIEGAQVLFKVSVGHRLFLLVVLQTGIATLLVITAMKYLSEIAADSQYMYRFQLLSIADLGRAQEDAAMLQRLTRPDARQLGHRAPPTMIAGLVRQLGDFNNRYRTEWETAEGTSNDASNFRRELLQLRRSDLIEKEKHAIAHFEESVQPFRDNSESSGVAIDEIRTQAPRTISFRAVLNLRFRYSLPLHIGRNVSATTFERHDVIHNVTFPASRIAGPPHEVGSRSGTAFNSAVGVAWSNRRFLWNRGPFNVRRFALR